MSQRRTNTSVENIEGLEDAIKECVRFIYCREASKIPIKRADIVKHLNSVCQSVTTSQVNTVVSEANTILKTVYGCKLVQVDAKSGVQYIVVLEEECPCTIESNATDPQHRRLLNAALTHIFLSGGSVKEDEMWRFLEEAGLMEETDHSSRKVLTTQFARQMYLSYTKVGEGDLARMVFEWGQRAMEEVPKMFILNKMARAFEKSPEFWCEQHREATVQTENVE